MRGLAWTHVHIGVKTPQSLAAVAELLTADEAECLTTEHGW